MLSKENMFEKFKRVLAFNQVFHTFSNSNFELISFDYCRYSFAPSQIIFVNGGGLTLIASALFDSLLACGEGVGVEPPYDLGNCCTYDHEIFDKCQVP